MKKVIELSHSSVEQPSNIKTHSVEELQDYDKKQLIKLILHYESILTNKEEIQNIKKEKLKENKEKSNDTSIYSAGSGKSPIKEGKKRKKGNKRGFDMSKYAQRYVALQIAYLGWDYHGFASQKDINNTIEGILLKALATIRLIENDSSPIQYSRCGRTDKGVSALGNVICLQLRSSQRPVVGSDGYEENVIYTNTEVEGGREEIDYTKIINRQLPPEIRVISWTTAPRKFSARYNATSRTYRYFFIKSELDIPALIDAGTRLIGEHDFRNFAKMDAVNVHNYTRTILSFDVHKVEDVESPDQLYYFQITGIAFLWHMVRNIAYILFLVGTHKEKPEIVDYLLDLDVCPRKPNYPLASGLPLILYKCDFEDITFEHKHGEDYGASRLLMKSYNQIWWENRIKLSLIGCSRKYVYENVLYSSKHDMWYTKVPMVIHKNYVPLTLRQKEDSYEEKVAGMNENKRKRRNIVLQRRKKGKDIDSIELDSTDSGE